MLIQVRRIYEDPGPDEGFRVLVDRLWPRGLSKEEAHFDLWDKDVAPSTELRKWWHHDKDTYAEFIRRYEAELYASGAALRLLEKAAGQARLTLLYSAHAPESNATVLARYLERLSQPRPT